MPKLFFRKKKKKAKHSLRDALTPGPAFIAVPSTPPPEKTSKNQFFPGKRPDISLPIPVPSNAFSNDSVLASKAPHFGESVGSYSLVGHEEGEGEESEAEPGYATVAAVSGRGARGAEVKNRSRLATPKHDNMEQDCSLLQEIHNPNADEVLPSLPKVDDRREKGRNQGGTVSPIRVGLQTSAQRSEDDTDGNFQLHSRNEREEEQEHLNGEERGVMTVNGYNDHQQQSERQREAMYSKVIKPKKQPREDNGKTIEDTGLVGANLPPKGPQSSSPLKKRAKEKSRSPLDSKDREKTNPRNSSSPRQHKRYDQEQHQHRILNDSDNRPWSDGGAAFDNRSRRRRSSPDARPRSTQLDESYDQSRRIVRHRRNTYDGYLYRQPHEEYHYHDNDIDLPLEYTDQSYLPSGEEEDTDTITDSYFQYGGDIPGDYPDGSHATPNRVRQQQQIHHRSRSVSFPNHQSRPAPVSHPRNTPSYPYTHSYRHDHSPPRRRKRPATSEGIPVHRHSNDIPFYSPPSLQPVYPVPPEQVYVFSEYQPDGKVQYYSATPVHSPPAPGSMLSPPTITPPPSFTLPPNQNPPRVTRSSIPQQPLSPKNMLTPSLHQVNVPNGGGGGGNINHGGTPSLTNQASKFSRQVPTGVTESGYFSGALGSSQQGIAQQKHQENSAANTNISGVSPTNHSPPDVPQLQLQTHLGPRPNSNDGARPQPPPPYHHHHNQHHVEHQQMIGSTSGRRSKSPRVSKSQGVSPSGKLLQNSLQRASLSPHSDFVSPRTAKLSHSHKSPRLDLPRGSGTVTTAHAAGLSPDNVGMATALYEQKEKILKARIKALEESTDELCTENVSLKQLCEVMKRDASGSVEQLQKKLSSVMSENQGYQHMNRDKDQQLDRDKNKIVHLKDEIEKLKEENNQLLVSKQSVELERKEWETVSEHAQSVLDENVCLLKQQELLKEQMKELKLHHQAIVSQLNSEVSKVKKEREAVETRLSSLQKSHGQVQSQFEKLVEQSTRQVSITDHQSALEEMHGLIEDLEERSDSEAKSQGTQLRILIKEKTSLVTKLTDAKAIILQLEQECTRMHRDIRVAHEKINEQNQDLEASRDREVASHERLSRAVSTAEKAIAEREAFAKIAKAQQKASERAGVKSALTGATAGKIEKEFELYKQETDTRLEQAATLLREKERENRVQKRQLQREITHLQLQLKSKQRRLDEMAKHKKVAEDRLDLMWRAKISKSGLATGSGGLSVNPVAAAAAAASSTTVNQLHGKLSKLSSHVHPR